VSSNPQINKHSVRLVGKSKVIAVRSAVTKVQGEVNFDPAWSPDKMGCLRRNAARSDEVFEALSG
jgi:metal-sulfur cluster biosynthetic enzyme